MHRFNHISPLCLVSSLSQTVIGWIIWQSVVVAVVGGGGGGGGIKSNQDVTESECWVACGGGNQSVDC